ncbi:MAG: dipeptidase [Rhodobacteraceae bacterium]|nr:dipeptidase [Paracoccaceae bacterium]
MMQVFDGHNDALGRLWCRNDDAVAAFAGRDGHINAASAHTGGLAGGLFAIYAPASRKPFDFALIPNGVQSMPLPAALEPTAALRAAIGQAGIAAQLQAAGRIALATDAASLRAAFDAEPIACILHLEGADCIDPDLLALEALYAMGLRSLGPVWSRPTIFGEGVPFNFNSTGDTGEGLTQAGQRLARRCLEMGIMLDTSHITMRGFWDIADLGAPVVATHSNAHAICPSARNLTDEQLRCIGATGGMVGLNFEPGFLSEVGWKTGVATLDDALRQLDHMIAVAGEDHVGLGSDFDGARLPQGMDGAQDLPVLTQAMQQAGYGPKLITKLCHGNWLRFLTDHFGDDT